MTRGITRLLQVNLERQGYEVTVTYSGREALQVTARECFDLAVIDASLPDMPGSEVIRCLSENPATAHIDVKLLSKGKDSIL